MQPTAKLNAYIDTIQSGRAEKAISKILQHLKKEGASTIFEIKAETQIKHSTITARLNTLLSTGVIFKAGKNKPEGATRQYTVYRYVSNEESRAVFGRLYQLEMGKRKLKSIINDEDQVFGMPIQSVAKYELEDIVASIDELKKMLE